MTPEDALEMLYSGTRNVNAPADFHDQMRNAFATVKAYILEQRALKEAVGEKKEAQKGTKEKEKAL